MDDCPGDAMKSNGSAWFGAGHHQGRAALPAQTSARTSEAMFSRAHPHGSASVAALAGGEIGANRAETVSKL